MIIFLLLVVKYSAMAFRSNNNNIISVIATVIKAGGTRTIKGTEQPGAESLINCLKNKLIIDF